MPQNLDLNYRPQIPPLPVFEEDFFVFNACPTAKFSKFQKGFTDEKGEFHKLVNVHISHNPRLFKNGSSKIFRLHFKGNFFRFSELMRLLSDYGLTWMRNRWWYRNEETGENYHPSNFLLVDFDDLSFMTGADLMQYEYDNAKTCLAIESSSNETVFSWKEEYIEEIGDYVERIEADNINGKTKFHVFLKTEPFDYNNETLRDKVSEETSCIFSFYGMDSNTWKVAKKKQEYGQPLSTAELYALETAWDPQAAYVSQKTFSVLNPALLEKHPERFHLAYKAEPEIGFVYRLNDFPSIFKELAEYVTVEPVTQFPKSSPATRKNTKGITEENTKGNTEEDEETRIKQQQDITGISLETVNPELPPAFTEENTKGNTDENEETRIKQQQDITDYKTWFSKRKTKSDAPFILLSSSRLLMEIVDKRNLPREASYPIAHWGNIYLFQNLQRRIKVGVRHKRVDLQIIALCYNARALASHFNIDLETDSTLSYDGIIRQVQWFVRETTEDSGADKKDPMNFFWITRKVYHWLFVATTEEMTKALSTSLMRMDTKIVPKWDINISEFEQLCSSESSTKEECFQAAKAKWRISKAVFNGLWRKAGIAQKQAHRPRTRRSKSKNSPLMKTP